MMLAPPAAMTHHRRSRYPMDTPLDVVLLAYEHRYLVERIEATQRELRRDARSTHSCPSRTPPSSSGRSRCRSRPELPSPLIPIAVAVAIGLLLAVARARRDGPARPHHP